MSYFEKNFIEHVAEELIDLIKEGDKPFAAILYATLKNMPLNKGDQIATGGNTEISHKNPNLHAEINVINQASDVLFDNMFKKDGELYRHIDVDKREKEFYLFVNTRPCPKCTAAIVDAQIFNTYFFYDNGYKKEISEMIIKSKASELGVSFVFEEIDTSMGLRYKFR